MRHISDPEPTYELTRPAKVSGPSSGGLIDRERLYLRLDPVETAQFAWIIGPAGSGKTSLADSWIRARGLQCFWYQIDARDEDVATTFYYLSRYAPSGGGLEPSAIGPEHLLDLDAFARRFFNVWFARWASPFAVVLDDYHSVSAGARVHDVVRILFEALPAHGRLLCLSREDPPPALSRCASHPSFERLDWTRLRFTDDEAAAWASRLEGGATERAIDANRQAHGWAAGLRLLLTGEPGVESAVAPPTGASTSTFDGDAQSMFDDLATKVLGTLEASDRLFLMRTSAAPACTPAMAESLSGRADAHSVLEQLRQRRMFTERRLQVGGETWYEYHPLFRSLLQARARIELPTDEVAILWARAAELHEQIGQADAAAELYREVALWDRLAFLVRQKAREWIEAGRAALVERAVAALPQALLDADPWLGFWRGCSLAFRDSTLARDELAASYRRFSAQDDDLARFLCLSQIFLTFPIALGRFSEMDKWIDEFEDALRRNDGQIPEPVEVPVLAACQAIAYRRLEHPILPALAERAEALAHSLSSARERLMLAGFIVAYAVWRGRMNHAHSLAESLASSDTNASGPATRIMFRLWRTIALHQVAQFEAAMTQARAAIELGHETGFHVMHTQGWLQVAMVASNTGDFATAEEALSNVPPVGDARDMYEYVRRGALATVLAAKGSPQEAIALLRPALDPEFTEGSTFMHAMTLAAFGQALVLNGQYVEGREYLDQALQMARRIGAGSVPFNCGFARAESLFATGDDAGGFGELRKGLRLGREQGLRNIHPIWVPKLVAAMCGRALEAGIEIDYVTWLIRTRGLEPPSPDLDAWPWPIRLYTFGRQAVVLNGERLSWRGKAQKRPLDLLCALIALGGRSVDRRALIDALWPDLDGDAAGSAFAMALLRLRKLLGRPDALVLEHGKLGLDDRQVWVDLWALRRVAQQSVPSPPTSTELARAARRLQGLYTGEFLVGEDMPCIARARSQIHREAVHAMRETAAGLQRHGAINEASVLLMHAIRIDSGESVIDP